MSRPKASTQPTISPTSLLRGERSNGLTNEFGIRHDIWIELDLQSLSVVRRTSANFSIFRIIGVPSSVSDGGLENSLVLGRRIMLQEYMFDSPEAPSCKGSDFWCDFS